MADQQPAIQLIANLVVEGEAGEVLLARYDPADERTDDDAADDEVADDRDRRWWLPAAELDSYQHPDEAADHALEAIGGLTVTSRALARVQSFRGRRGWHVSFDYRVVATGRPASDGVPAAWHPVDDLPPTMHGNWERDTIAAVLAADPS